MKARMACSFVLAATLACPAAACPQADATAAAPRLLTPMPNEVLRPFGITRHPILQIAKFHTGVDYRATPGEPVRAAAAGEVVEAGRKGEYGNYIAIRHGGGFQTAYGHLRNLAVREGDCVDAGAIVGGAGSTGLSTGPALHFEVLKDGRHIDPASVLEARRASYFGANGFFHPPGSRRSGNAAAR